MKYIFRRGKACLAQGESPTEEGKACLAPTGRFGKPVGGSVSTIIGSFKSAATKRVNEMRKIKGAPLWQRNFYEHIIRDEEDLNRIREYIELNPAYWMDDEYYPTG